MSHGSFSAASKFLQDLNRPSRNIHVCLRPRHLPINNMGAGTETTPPVAAAQPPARTQAAAPPAGPEEVVLSLNEARLYAQAEHQAPALVAEGTLSIKLVDSPTPGQQQARGQVGPRCSGSSRQVVSSCLPKSTGKVDLVSQLLRDECTSYAAPHATAGSRCLLESGWQCGLPPGQQTHILIYRARVSRPAPHPLAAIW
jgi:hypothetical protein